MTDSSMYDFDELEQQLGALARSMSEDDWRREQPPADLFPAIVAEIRSGGGATSQAPPAQQPSVSPAYYDQDQSGREYRDQNHQVPPQAQPHQPQHGQHTDHAQWAPQPQAGQPQQPAPVSVPRPEPANPPTVDRHAEVANLGQHREAREQRSSRSGLLLAAAAVVGALVMGGAVLSGVFSSDGLSGDVVASADVVNDELPVAFDQAGTAVLRNDNGDLFLDVDVPALPDSGDAFYEVWMIDTNVDGMISLGVLTADGRIDVPDSIDPANFPVVDLSVEPLDGDPTHSGQSILRGILDI